MDKIHNLNTISSNTSLRIAFEDKMLKELLDSLEDPSKPLLGPNYWLLKKLGVLLPKDKFNKVIYILIHQMLLVFLITEYIEVFVLRSDLNLLLDNLKLTMQCSLCVIKINTFLLWQDDWKQIIDYITAADKYERDNGDAHIVRGKILDSYTKYCRLVTYLYCILVLTTIIATTIAPLTNYLSITNYRDEIGNVTVSFPHLVSSWMPFDKNQSPGCWITLLWHLYICCYGSSTLAAYDSTIIVIIVYFGGKLELLRERSKEIFGSAGERINEDESRKRIGELHNMHVQLMKHWRIFNSVMSPVMFVYVVVCSSILCASAFQLIAATNTTQKILMAIYFIFSIAQLFIFCWHSNDTLIKSQSIIFGPYESKWWAANVHLRKSVLMLAGQFQINQVLKAGPFANMTLPTCITILKGAYSYYTLLRK